MRRGTTPTHIFYTDIDLTEAEVIWLTYKVDGKITIEKEKADLTVEADRVSFKLTQEETLAIMAGRQVKMQIRARFADGSAIASQVMATSVEEILKDGVI